MKRGEGAAARRSAQRFPIRLPGCIETTVARRARRARSWSAPARADAVSACASSQPKRVITWRFGDWCYWTIPIQEAARLDPLSGWLADNGVCRLHPLHPPAREGSLRRAQSAAARRPCLLAAVVNPQEIDPATSKSRSGNGRADSE